MKENEREGTADLKKKIKENSEMLKSIKMKNVRFSDLKFSHDKLNLH